MLGWLLALGIGSAIAGGVSSAVAAKKQAEAVQDSNATNIQLAHETNAFNSAEAQKQRDFEERMSNTAVQRAKADYEAAGFNPYLAATNPSSTPVASSASGVSAKVQAADVGAGVLGSIGDTLISISNTAIKVSMLKNMLGNKATNDLLKSVSKINR